VEIVANVSSQMTHAEDGVDDYVDEELKQVHAV
jgi:hypothetical protein